MEKTQKLNRLIGQPEQKAFGKLQLPGTHIAQQLRGVLPGVAFVASAAHQKEVRGGIQGLS